MKILTAESAARPAPAIRDLAWNAEAFRRGRPFPDGRYGQLAHSGEPASEVVRLGSLPFWRGRRDFPEEMSDLQRRRARPPPSP